MEDKLLPNIPSKSIAVLYNASYHNKEDEKRPTNLTQKKKIFRTLQKTDVSLDDETRTSHVRSVPVNKKYTVDKLFLNP